MRATKGGKVVFCLPIGWGGPNMRLLCLGKLGLVLLICIVT